MISIELMNRQDIPEVLELSNRAFGSMAWNERDFHRAVESNYDYPYVLRMDGEFLGFCMLRQLGPEAEIQEICVHEKFRGRGYGEALMDQMIQTARMQQGHSIFLEVRESNHTARKLYQKKGFTEEYRRKNYYTDPTEDAVIMQLIL